MQKHIAICKRVVEACQRLYGRNMLASADGNVSYRLDSGEILITPSGLAKAFMRPEEMALINLDGQALNKAQPSGEKLMHLEVYRRCPQARAVVHAHPPYAIAWTVSHPDLNELPNNCLSEVILAAGRIPIVPYARPSTQAMGDHLHPYLPKHRLMILARHGALSWGETLDEAVQGMERLEHVAQILLLAKMAGGLSELSASEVEALWAMREQIGERTL